MSAAVLQFPRTMKRGPKMRRGPCAQMLSFPTTESATRAEWYWLSTHHDRWDCEQLPTHQDIANIDEAEVERHIAICTGILLGVGKERITEAVMRREIVKWRAEIEKRARVKGWLVMLGVNLKDAFDPQRALFFAFDSLHAGEQPASA